MARCARERRVFFVEEPVFDEGPARLVTRAVAPNVVTAVPFLPRDSPCDVVVDSQRRLLDELVEQFRITRPLLWFYTPMAMAYADHLESSATVFDCMDELSAFQGASSDLSVFERALFERADLVFTGGFSLYEAKRHHHPNVHPFPSSVDAAHFARARAGGGDGLADPEDQRDLARPRIGFFGVIDERMDQEILARMADAHPEWSIVLIGPVVKIDPGALPRRPNIHYLGPRPYESLPDYIAGWDVAIMPFALNASTRFISPTKTLEYLAAGRPVVSTPIRDVVRPYGEAGIVRIAEPTAFVGAVEETLDEAPTRAAAFRRAATDALVANTSWDRTWAAMDALIASIDPGGREVA